MRLALALPALSLAACAASLPDDEAGGASPAMAAAVSLVQVTSFGSNPGGLRMFYYAPTDLAAGAPLVVAMHGCTQSASVYATQTEWSKLADRYRFAVVFPEQPSANNSQSCFNWFLPEDTSRGQGEALSIKQMVDEMKTRFASDPARIYATGMSAGGFMTEIMLATYPDVFAGGAVNAGGPYRCAASLTEAFSCMQGNVQRTPQQWGDLVRAAASGYTGPYPRLVAFHGASDSTVAPAALQETVDQWINVLGIDGTADLSETFRTSTHKVYRDGAGRSMVETYLLASTGHALSVDPGTAVDQGGATGAYSEDHDVYSSYYAAQFWGLWGSSSPGDSTPPVASVTAPAEGAVVSGVVSVTAQASDEVGVARVELLVDGALRASDTAAPYAFSLDTAALANGAHTLVARAFDAAGNAGSSSPRAVSVQNAGDGAVRRETFSAASGPDQAGWTLGGFSLDSSKDATGVAGSRSVFASAAPSFSTVTRTATWAGLTLGAAPRLSYSRQVTLSGANITASAALRVIVNDGADHVVDEVAVNGFRSYSETAWTARSGLDLSAYAGKTVTLKLVLTASDLSSTVTRASAWIDQLEIR